MKISLNKIRDKNPCEGGWEKLLKSLNKTQADDTEVSINHILESNGIDDTLWIIYNCIDDYDMDKRNMVADISERVLHIWEDWAKDNLPEHLDAPRKAIEVCRDEKATKEEVEAAGRAAGAAARAAAKAAARAATWSADWVALAGWDAIWYANWSALAAWHALTTWHALDARSARNARNAEEQAQREIILKYFGEK